MVQQGMSWFPSGGVQLRPSMEVLRCNSLSTFKLTFSGPVTVYENENNDFEKASHLLSLVQIGYNRAMQELGTFYCHASW